jgi:hypothetical protein
VRGSNRRWCIFSPQKPFEQVGLVGICRDLIDGLTKMKVTESNKGTHMDKIIINNQEFTLYGEFYECMYSHKYGELLVSATSEFVNGDTDVIAKSLDFVVNNLNKLIENHCLRKASEEDTTLDIWNTKLINEGVISVAMTKEEFCSKCRITSLGISVDGIDAWISNQMEQGDDMESLSIPFEWVGKNYVPKNGDKM